MDEPKQRRPQGKGWPWAHATDNGLSGALLKTLQWLPPAKPLCPHSVFSPGGSFLPRGHLAVSGDVWGCQNREGLLLASNGQRLGMLINLVQQQDTCPRDKVSHGPECQRCSGWDTWRHLPTTHPPTTAGQESATSSLLKPVGPAHCCLHCFASSVNPISLQN